jgi:hypothetical protein
MSLFVLKLLLLKHIMGKLIEVRPGEDISAAIDNDPRDHSHILLLSGVHLPKTVVIKKHVNIFCEAGAVIDITGDGRDYSCGVYINGPYNVLIYGMTIISHNGITVYDNNATTSGKTPDWRNSIKFINCKIVGVGGCGQRGINVGENSKVRILGCEIKQFIFGVHLADCYVSVLNCDISDCSEAGIYIYNKVGVNIVFNKIHHNLGAGVRIIDNDNRSIIGPNTMFANVGLEIRMFDKKYRMDREYYMAQMDSLNDEYRNVDAPGAPQMSDYEFDIMYPNYPWR